MSAGNEQEFILEGAEAPPDVVDDEKMDDDDIEEEIEEAGEPPARHRVVSYKLLDDIEYDPLEQRDDVFIAPFAGGPITVQSPVMTLNDDLVDADGEFAEMCCWRVKKAHVPYFQRAEDRLLDSAKANCVEWFGQELDDEFLESSHRRFMDEENRVLTVRVHDGVVDELKRKTKARIVLEADGAVFTRSEYGLVWTMMCVSKLENGRSQYLFDEEEVLGAADVTTGALCDAMRDKL
jgi:hypothetical protein